MRKNQQKSKNKDQKEKNGRKKKRKLHTQVYTVEMGKCTKINKRVKNKLQREKNEPMNNTHVIKEQREGGT